MVVVEFCFRSFCIDHDVIIEIVNLALPSSFYYYIGILSRCILPLKVVFLFIISLSYWCIISYVSFDPCIDNIQFAKQIFANCLKIYTSICTHVVLSFILTCYLISTCPKHLCLYVCKKHWYIIFYNFFLLNQVLKIILYIAITHVYIRQNKVLRKLVKFSI